MKRTDKLTTIALDPVLSNIMFTANLIMHLRAPGSSSPYEKPSGLPWKRGPPLVSALIPIFNEKRESILATARCLAAQTWMKLEALFIMEPEEADRLLETRRRVEEAILLLKGRGISAKLIVTDGKVKLKPHALNCALREAEGEIICVYDADNTFPERQIEDAVGLILEKGYDVVQSKIYRSRETFVGRYLMLDTFVWQRKFLPAVHAWARIFPFSGEGLFIRREALDEVGGFPEVLTEDAYLSILLTEKEKRFGLLDSEVYELAPIGWRSHFRQRVRWFRGYLTCLGRVLKAKVSLKAKIALSVMFSAPITCSFSLITWAFFTTYWLSWAFLPQLYFIAPWMLHWLYKNAIFYWSAFLAYIGNPIVIFSYMHSLANTKMERSAPLALIVPLYWIFIGAAAISSFFRSTKFWGKTER